MLAAELELSLICSIERPMQKKGRSSRTLRVSISNRCGFADDGIQVVDDSVGTEF
jgi:hypothetical protein